MLDLKILPTALLKEYLEKVPKSLQQNFEALKDAVNRGQIFRYLSKPWNDDELKKTIEDSYLIYHIKKEEQEKNEKLILTNEQLEFILRQKLLS